MNNITNEQLDGLIKSAVNSSGPFPPDEKFSQIISALRELRDLRAAMLQGAEPVSQPYKLPPNSFTSDDLEMMSHGDNPQANAYRELLALRRNSPVIQEDWQLVPKKLSAEDGAKGALSGEFSETKFINCPECFGDEECETCDGSGRIEISVPVTWTTIKAIWTKGVDHFSAAPQQEGK